MDEVPLIGDPGSFIRQKTRDKSATAAKNTTVGTTEDEPTKSGATNAEPKSTKAQAPVPPPLTTDLPLELGKKTKGGEKSPLSPGGGKKRKKSKVVTPKSPK